jgi:hypothetical protein
MKLRHTAALALVGWYLMVPPYSEKPIPPTNLPPLSKWSVYRRYNAPDECRYARSAIADGFLEDAPPDFLQRFGNNFKSTFVRARCVATDDPRLKEK